MNMKKLVSLVLALVMVMAMSVNAMAASITIEQNQTTGVVLTDKTFAAYKILDLKVVGESGYVYTVPEAMKGFYNTRYGLTGTEGDYDYQVSQKITAETDLFAFAADALAYAKANSVMPNKATATAPDSVTIQGLEAGYYVIEDEGTETPISALMLKSTNDSITVAIKADAPNIDKVDDKESVDVGEVVTYTVTSKIPNTTGYKSYDYTIYDTMTDGLTFNPESITVKVGDTVIAEENYTYTPNVTGFTLKVNVMNLQEYKGQNLTITYTATVNDNAVAEVENNKVYLEYSNNPNDDTSKEKTPEIEETVYSAKIVIDKYVQGSEDTKLAGAKFVLKNTDGKFYKYTAATETEPAKVEWVDNQTEATVVTTDANGAATFNGLADGTYKLVEIEAPAGYNLLTGEVEVVITGASTGEDDNVTYNLTSTAKVANAAGAQLPETGGMGTTMIYIAGGLLVAFAAVMLITKRRMNAAE